MAVGFSAADFNIVPEGDQLPFPITDENGFTRYRATLMLPSRTQLNTLLSYLSQVDVLPAFGGSGMVITTAGVGKRTLTYPAQDGVEHTQSAILTSCVAKVRMMHAGYIVADAEWLFV